MKILVTYYSQSGNTKKVADAIFEHISFPKSMLKMEEAESLNDYDLIFAGFPVWQFGPAKPARKFLSGLTMENHVALFVTHAMDPDPDDPDLRLMLDGILEKCRKAADKTNLNGFFHCRGELSHETANMLTSSGIPMLEKFAGMRDETLGHPDEHDLEEAVNFCSGILNAMR